MTGRLTLSDGRPAAHAAVFLGDNDPEKTTLEMGSDYYYTTYADADGVFTFTQVRADALSYGLQAWSNGTNTSALANVTTVFAQNDVVVASGGATTDLGNLTWPVSSSTNKTQLFQVGAFDRYAYGFAYGGAPHEHALVANCPADLTFTAGTSATEEWCFGQTYVGNWTVVFDVPSAPGEDNNATLIVSLAGYSTGTTARVVANDAHVLGELTSGDEGLENDPGLYRSATAAGEWRYLEFGFDAVEVLAEGENRITFEVTRNTTWRGFMWDSIILEW